DETANALFANVMLFLVIEEFRGLKEIAAARPGAAVVVNLDHDQPIDVREWERIEQDVMDGAENGGGRTDAESKREQGHGGESEILPQHSRSVTQILPEHLDHSSHVDLVSRLRDPADLAKLQRRHSPRLNSLSPKCSAPN